MNQNFDKRLKYLDKEGIICDFYPEIPESRRQDLKPDAYIRAGSIYVVKRELIAKGLRYGEGKALGYILPDDRFINIDERRDLFVAEKIMSER
mgnify:CR=1 FL=1